MSMKAFLRRYRAEITDHVAQCGVTVTNDRERELWVLNDESLYNWARCEGVRI
jgi:hypothetical protein